MDAPSVVPNGVGILARKILQVSHEHDIPLVENKPLAQTLYRFVDAGAPIPNSLYKAVTALLAYVYKANHSLSR